MDSALKMRILDYNFGYYGIDIAKIMENAGREVAREIERKFPARKKIAVFCGTGNNGGDGFVAARYLSQKNAVTVFLPGSVKEIRTEESKLNWKRLQKTKKIRKKFLQNKTQLTKLKKSLSDFDLIVDAMLGIGIKGKLKEPYASVVKILNQLPAKVKRVSIDVPTPNFKANFIISLHNKKVSGKNVKVVDIGIPTEMNFYTGPGHVKFLQHRKKRTHKGENGIVLVVGGSKQFHGALVYAALAVSRLVDLVLVSTSKENIPVIKKYSPEFIVSDLNSAKKRIKRADSVLIGPGLGESTSAKSIVNALLKLSSPKKLDKKIILDASALRLLDKKLLHRNCVLTPHKNEFETLFRTNANTKNVKAMAKKHKCIVVLKGPVDLISDGKETYKNFSGNEGMTTGGTGDILSGLTAGFAAKNELLHSALAGTFLVGLAGDLLKAEKGLMYNASDLVKKLPEAKRLCENY